MPIVPSPNPDHFGGARVRHKRRSISITAGHKAVVNFVLEDDQGNPIDLTTYGFDSSESVGSSAPAPNLRVTLAEHSGSDAKTLYASIMSSARGLVEFQVPAGIAATPGIWLIQFAIEEDDGPALAINDAYLVVNRAPGSLCYGMPSIPEVRLFLRDFAQENELLDAVDFDVTEIAFAASLCIDEWNERPPVTGQRYTTLNFPYRYHWLIGIVSRLFSIAAEHYARNRMPYEAGGKSVDDKNRMNEYLQRAEMARQQWQSFIAERKTLNSLVMDGFFEISGVMPNM